jgi:hypothetical protein
MGADEARHERLFEIAALAHQHRVAVNFACAFRSLFSTTRPTPNELAKVAAADAATAAADKALVDWDARTAPR